MSGNSEFLEELEVLQSIYEDELVLVSSDDSSAETKMTIHPSTADDKDGKYVCLTLHFLFTFSSDPLKTYPNRGPDTAIKNPRGISDSHLASIEENIRSLVKNMVGEQMMFSLIEYARESLSDNNHPSCVCPICLEKFEEGGFFFRTECYHYFHRACIKSYVEVSENLVCPVCRLEFQIDESIMNSEVSEQSNEEEIFIDESFFKWRKQFEHIYEKQKQNGGIIDLEAEKNKFLITLTDSRPASPATVGSDTESNTNETVSEKGNMLSSPKLRSVKHASEDAAGINSTHPNVSHCCYDKSADISKNFERLDIKEEKNQSGDKRPQSAKHYHQNRQYKNEKYYRDTDDNRHENRSRENRYHERHERGGYRQRGNRHHQYQDEHSQSRHRQSDDSRTNDDRFKSEKRYRYRDYERNDRSTGSQNSNDNQKGRSSDGMNGTRDQTDHKDGPNIHSKDHKKGPRDRSKDRRDDPRKRSKDRKDGLLNSSEDHSTGSIKNTTKEEGRPNEMKQSSESERRSMNEGKVESKKEVSSSFDKDKDYKNLNYKEGSKQQRGPEKRCENHRVSGNDNSSQRPQSSRSSKKYDSKPHPNQRKYDKKHNSKLEGETIQTITTDCKEKRPPPGFSQIIPKEDSEQTERTLATETNKKKPPPGFENAGQIDQHKITNQRNNNDNLQKLSQKPQSKVPPGFHKADREKPSHSNSAGEGRTFKTEFNGSEENQEGGGGRGRGGNRNRNRKRQGGPKPPQDK